MNRTEALPLTQATNEDGEVSRPRRSGGNSSHRMMGGTLRVSVRKIRRGTRLLSSIPSYVLPNDNGPYDVPLGLTDSQASMYSSDMNCAAVVRYIIEKDAVCLSEAFRTRYNVYYIIRQLTLGTRASVKITIGDETSYMDVADDTIFGIRTWWRLHCNCKVLTMEDAIADLGIGTSDIPPKLRCGGDDKGSFMEVIQPSWFVAHYSKTGLR